MGELQAFRAVWGMEPLASLDPLRVGVIDPTTPSPKKGKELLFAKPKQCCFTCFLFQVCLKFVTRIGKIKFRTYINLGECHAA